MLGRVRVWLELKAMTFFFFFSVYSTLYYCSAVTYRRKTKQKQITHNTLSGKRKKNKMNLRAVQPVDRGAAGNSGIPDLEVRQQPADRDRAAAVAKRMSAGREQQQQHQSRPEQQAVVFQQVGDLNAWQIETRSPSLGGAEKQKRKKQLPLCSRPGRKNPSLCDPISCCEQQIESVVYRAAAMTSLATPDVTDLTQERGTAGLLSKSQS